MAVWEDFQEVNGSELDGENSKASNREHFGKDARPQDGRLTHGSACF